MSGAERLCNIFEWGHETKNVGSHLAIDSSTNLIIAVSGTVVLTLSLTRPP